MVARLAALALVPALLLLLAPAAAVPAVHYEPGAGDTFRFYETVSVSNGAGNYTGYVETTAVNGTLNVTATHANGTENASYDYVEHNTNNSGGNELFTAQGNFSFSATSFLYVRGTDNQTGYTNPYVWFYINNSLPTGATFYLLTSRLTVDARNASFDLGTAAGSWVATIYADGTGSYVRDDSYGVFTATYDWKAYFDPSTGYVVGYVYTEHDADGSGDGFQYVDSLRVTSASYPLTPGTAPAASSPALSLLEYALLAVVVIVVLALLVYALARRARRGPSLPRHSAGGIPRYTPPPPGPAPPPISLAPGDQPRIQQVVVKEVVKVNCRYCGSLIDSTAEKCPFCGATRT
jgi:hypothetical protein